jgi:MoaA/NifB/PqqE/SkfB family radical SAM enzyme
MSVGKIFFEISGICNAKCPWCQSGRKNRYSPTPPKDVNYFVDIEKFKQSIFHMKNIGLIDNGTNIDLFSWGEPFLHPDFKEIIRFLKEENINASLSTNASKVILFDNKDDLCKLCKIRFSMPGFSQKSYDKIHGFQFDKIIANIDAILTNFRKCGFTGRAEIALHLYQFNLHEVDSAFKFAEQRNMGFLPHAAFINDHEKSTKYLKDELDIETLKSAGRELFLSCIEKRREEALDNYYCPQFDMISVDNNCNVITCCSESTIYKNICDVKCFEEINTWRINSDICKDCLKSKHAYVVHNIVTYEELLGIKL